MTTKVVVDLKVCVTENCIVTNVKSTLVVLEVGVLTRIPVNISKLCS